MSVHGALLLEKAQKFLVHYSGNANEAVGVFVSLTTFLATSEAVYIPLLRALVWVPVRMQKYFGDCSSDQIRLLDEGIISNAIACWTWLISARTHYELPLVCF